MGTAEMIARRSTCDRAFVGCVITQNNRIVSTGYNGSMPGCDHCDEVGHLIINNSCVRTLHAETNALINAAKAGVSTDGAKAYITHFPCFNCFKSLVAAGIDTVVYSQVKQNNMTPEIEQIIKSMGHKIIVRDIAGSIYN